jgi:L-glyceraldehyde 3-phosphate reductase
MTYRRCGRSGLRLPAISFGLWQGTGSYVDDAATRSIVHTAFDHGITHFDLANNYGNPAGASEELFGRILRDMPRHELVISSKAGYYMWPGPSWRRRQPQASSRELRAVAAAARRRSRRHLLLAPF